MRKPTRKLAGLLGTGLLLGATGCSSGHTEPGPERGLPPATALASLSRATDCGDLLTKIQDDAIAKVQLAAQLAKNQRSGGAKRPGGVVTGGGVGFDDDEAFDSGDDGSDSERESKPRAPAPQATETSSGTGNTSKEDAAGDPSSATGGANVSGPTGASGTNSQVKNVEEADFVKVVNNGAGIFLLHGNTLQKLKSYPAAETALSGSALKIEGAPSELFVTDEGKAVVFSSAQVASTRNVTQDPIGYGCPSGGDCYHGGNGTKVTIADVTVDPPRVERELYYEGSYVSSRRYDSESTDVVRLVLQGDAGYYGLYEPNIQWYDAWGREYDEAAIDKQLGEWTSRQAASIRMTTLDDWLPSAQEVQGGQKVTLARQCESYYVPAAGLSDYGLTQVLSLDVKQPTQPVAGVTIVGATSTVYSNAQRLVLAQPDYRWSGDFDFGVVDEQRTALHVFDLAGAGTSYVASGWVTGQLPPFNPQFGIDVGGDGTLRVATTGFVRTNPQARPGTAEFWQQRPETHVSLAQVSGNQLNVVAKTENLGLPNETIQSARFVGDRAYVVTYEQKDPLVVVDVKNPLAPVVLGKISIPGFSQYMHPLDDTHLITIGPGANFGLQLQLFDVTDPKSIPLPKLLDFGSSASSEASYQHKAFTLYNGVLALPVSGASTSGDYRYRYYTSELKLVKVDVQSGFALLGSVDHGPVFAEGGCGQCDERGCYDYACSYPAEVRRGQFISGGGATYVYSFSNGGVLVNDLANLETPVAKVLLPKPAYDSGYGGISSGGTKPRPPEPGREDDEGPADDDSDLFTDGEGPGPAPTSGLDAGSAPGADAGTAMPLAPDAG